MTEVICRLKKGSYNSCEYNKDGKCTRDKVVIIDGHWDEDEYGICATGLYGERKEVD